MATRPEDYCLSVPQRLLLLRETTLGNKKMERNREVDLRAISEGYHVHPALLELMGDLKSHPTRCALLSKTIVGCFGLLGVAITHIFDKIRVAVHIPSLYPVELKGTWRAEAVSMMEQFVPSVQKISGWYSCFGKVVVPAEALPLILRLLMFQYCYDAMKLTPNNVCVNAGVGAATGALAHFLVVPFAKLHHIFLIANGSPQFEMLLNYTYPHLKEHKSPGSMLSYLYKFGGILALRGAILGILHMPLYLYLLEGWQKPLYQCFLQADVNKRLYDTGYARKLHTSEHVLGQSLIVGGAMTIVLYLFDLGFVPKLIRSIQTGKAESGHWLRELWKSLTVPKSQPSSM